MAAALIHNSSYLGFALNTGTTSEPKKSTVSINRIKEAATAESLANVAGSVDALFAHDITAHTLTKKYELTLA